MVQSLASDAFVKLGVCDEPFGSWRPWERRPVALRVTRGRGEPAHVHTRGEARRAAEAEADALHAEVERLRGSGPGSE